MQRELPREIGGAISCGASCPPPQALPATGVKESHSSLG